MSEEKKNWLARKWESLDPDKRRYATVTIVAVAIFGALYSFVSSGETNRRSVRHDPNDIERTVFTRSSARETNLHGLAATVQQLEQQNRALLREMEGLRERIRVGPASEEEAQKLYNELAEKAMEAARQVTQEELALKTMELEDTYETFSLSKEELLAEIEREKERLAKAASSEPRQEQQGGKGSGAEENDGMSIEAEEKDEGKGIVSDGMGADQLSWDTNAISYAQKQETDDQRGRSSRDDEEDEVSGLRHITREPTEQERALAIKEEQRKEEEKPSDIFIPAGSIFSGTLITGLDAPTGTKAKNTPFPSLLRIKKEALLPNRYRADVRECFLVASGYGDLSSERVYMRAETISCVRNDGGVVEAPINMYAAGEDGKAGVRGKLQTKQGQYLAKALAAGVLDAFASVFSEVPTATINTSAQDQLPFQSAMSDEALQSAAVEGTGDAMERLADFYIEMAQSVFPIIQVDAGRQIDFIMTAGTSLKLR